MAEPVYLRPTAFLDAPFGSLGKALRLAGSLTWFSAVELIERRGPARIVPVAEVDAELDGPGRAILARITAPRPPLVLGPRTVPLDTPQVMGILNVTPDSFSDAGAHHGDAAAAASAGIGMAAAGAAIIDVGGESTRPGARPIWEGDEAARVLPVIERLAGAGTAVSLDTRNAAVMAQGLKAGARLINDVSALTHDPRAAGIVADAGCPVVLMHHQGTPETMQDAPDYEDVLLDVYDWLAERIAAAEAAGIERSQIIVDPGIGFGKTLRHNLALMNGLALFHGLGCPLMLGASRKRMIGALDNEAPVGRRLGGSLALALAGAMQGAHLLRVHDVPETMQSIRVWRGMRDVALTL
ncbi:dihydropteroate synthase [Sphingomonas quercus]|uniref:dihydropteroate synthase n=1 Tax=Sphingomonas quercus TaxID=2842451 RepID=A0ABS6BDV6_9SPHN|nr:dihydropteroate synthase [Sphingomonas quercus]MBU3076502.1 dihydropteroate synthase [Sphingomonas quercus]